MSGTPTLAALFDPDFLREVETFALRAAEAQKGGRLAEQRTRARGQGAEFADFKPYVPGDDLRAVDWNIYRRLGRVFVRVFEERQDLPVYIMPDVSSSMFVEEPPRIDAALRVAMAVAAVALRQHDAVGLLPFAATVSMPVRSASGKASLMRIARTLAAIEPGGGTALADALAHVARMKMRRGLLVLISDFFDSAGLDAVIDALGRLPHRLLLVQMVKAHDADPALMPALQGDVTLDDGEASTGTPITVTPALLARYREGYERFSAQLTGFARGRGVGLARIDADAAVLPQLRRLFADGGLRL